jgi:ABC-type glycerol-3-phosphate transport system substrate-binding protein
MRTTTRRSALAVLAAVTATAGLAACGGGSGGGSGGGGTNGAGKTLDVYVGANTQFPEQTKAWREDIGNQFKTQTGATVKWEEFASANDEVTKIETSAVSGNGPDIYGVGTTMTPTAFATGAFTKLDDAAWQKVGGKSRFLPATLGISGPDANNQIGIPWATRPFVMAYNKDLLKAAGIDKPATSWDELGQQAKKLTHGDQYGLAIAYKDGFDPWKFAWQMSIQAGNPLVQGKTAKIQDPTVKKAYQTYFGWLTQDHVVNPAAVGWSNTQALAEFAKGKTGYFLRAAPDRAAGHVVAALGSAGGGEHPLRGQPPGRRLLQEQGPRVRAHQPHDQRAEREDLLGEAGPAADERGRRADGAGGPQARSRPGRREEVRRDAVHRRLGDHPARAHQRGRAVDPGPGQGFGPRLVARQPPG